MDESRTRSNAAGGIGFLGALAIVFIALKLTGYIAWSWLWFFHRSGFRGHFSVVF